MRNLNSPLPRLLTVENHFNQCKSLGLSSVITCNLFQPSWSQGHLNFKSLPIFVYINMEFAFKFQLQCTLPFENKCMSMHIWSNYWLIGPICAYIHRYMTVQLVQCQAHDVIVWSVYQYDMDQVLCLPRVSHDHQQHLGLYFRGVL